MNAVGQLPYVIAHDLAHKNFGNFKQYKLFLVFAYFEVPFCISALAKGHKSVTVRWTDEKAEAKNS